MTDIQHESDFTDTPHVLISYMLFGVKHLKSVPESILEDLDDSGFEYVLID